MTKGQRDVDVDSNVHRRISFGQLQLSADIFLLFGQSLLNHPVVISFIYPFACSFVYSFVLLFYLPFSSTMRLLVPAGSMDGRYLFFVTRNCDPVFLEGSANYACHRPPTVSGTVVSKNLSTYSFFARRTTARAWIRKCTTKQANGANGNEREKKNWRTKIYTPSASDRRIQVRLRE